MVYVGLGFTHFMICCIVSFLLAPEKGREPVNISNIKTPNDHQSTADVCPLRDMISGAMYSTVPQNENVFSSLTASLLNPKSVKLMWPPESSKMLVEGNDGNILIKSS